MVKTHVLRAWAMVALCGCGTSLSPNPTTTPTGASPSTSQRLELEPSSVTLQILPGSALPTQAFSLWAVTGSGRSRVSSAQFVTDDAAVGSIDANGLLTLTGKMGGMLTIHAEWGGLSVSATATVFLKQPSPSSPLVPPTASDAFSKANEEDVSFHFLYPYAGTMVPRGIDPMRIQWSGAASATGIN